MEALYDNGGNTTIVGPYLSQIQSQVDGIVPLEDSVMVQLISLSGHLTAVADDGIDHGGVPNLELACHPNPFNDRTIVHLFLPEGGPLHLAVYNVLGQKVRTLADGHHRAGSVRIVWDGRDAGGDEVSAGLYFCRLERGGLARTMKMVLLK